MGDIFLLLLVLFGICIGSFLGVIIDRLPRGENFAKGRSYCERCKKKLTVIDLVPLFSFLFLKGRCRYCKTSLSWYYPVIELTTGLVFALTVLSFGISLETGFYFFIASLLIAIFFIDLRHGIIPFSLVLAASIATILHIVIFTPVFFLNFLLSALGAGIFFFLLFAVTRGRGMGFGDVVYVLFMGLLLGFPKIVLGLYIAFLSGALAAIVLVVLKQKKMKGGTVPFGPFLVAGTLASLFWGNIIIPHIMVYLTN